MFDKQFKRLRKEKNMTQADVARDFNITQQAIAKWEAGKSFPDPNTLIEIAEYFDVDVDTLLGVSKPNRHKLVPIIGSVRAGYNALAYEEHMGSEFADVENADNYRYFIVKGHSMEPYIKEGDLALVQIQSTLEDGELGVFVHGDGEGTLKKFSRKGKGIELIPFNEAYETIELSDEELNPFHIVGKVIKTITTW